MVDLDSEGHSEGVQVRECQTGGLLIDRVLSVAAYKKVNGKVYTYGSYSTIEYILEGSLHSLCLA